MVSFIFGRPGYGKSHKILDLINEDCKSNRDVYLIIPEQQSVSWETKAAKALPPSAFKNLHITTFVRLSDLVNRKFGGLNYTYADSAEKNLIMWSALLSVNNSLSIYKSIEGQEDKLAPTLLGAITELKNNKKTSSIIEDAALKLNPDDTTSAQLIKKLNDLSLIMSSYDNLLKERFGEADDVLSKLDKTLSSKDFFKGSSVYIDSFYALTPVQLGIVESIIRQADDVTITFSYNPTENDTTFNYIKKMHKSLNNIVNKLSKKPNVTILDNDMRRTSSTLKYLERNCWNESADPFNDEINDDEIKIINCSDRYSEAEAVANEILKLIHEGNNWGDIAVIAHSIDKLEGIIDTTFDSKNIPYHLSKRSELSSEPTTRLWLSALSIVANGWKGEDIIAYAKTNMFNISDDSLDLFEKYITTWNINGKTAYESEWTMNPSGYIEKESTKDINALESVKAAKAIIITPLLNFAQALNTNVMSIKDIAKACYDLLVEVDVYNFLKVQSKELEKENKLDEAIKKSQVFSTLCEVLDSMVNALPDAKLSVPKFARLLKKVIDERDIGTIPSAMDEVILGSASSLRTDAIKYVFVLGAFDGEFPSTPPEDSVFSDIEKMLLEDCDLVFLQNQEEQRDAAKFFFYHALSVASKGIRVFIPSVDNGENVIPSEGAVQIMNLFPNAKTIRWDSNNIENTVWDDASMAEAVYKNKGNTKFIEAAQNYGFTFRDNSLINADNCVLSDETAKKVFPTSMTMSHSRLDKYVNCKFNYICNYVLNIEEENKASIHSVDIGNYIHKILEDYFQEVKGRDLPIPDDESKAIINKITDKYINILTKGHITPRLKYLFEKLKKNVFVFISDISEEFAASDFRPIKFELPIYNSSNTPSPLIFKLPDNATISLTGKIDRVDTYTADDGTTYVKIVDYKTGEKKFSIDNIKLGLDMQLLLYLFTIWKTSNTSFKNSISGNGKIVPAGAMYLGISPNVANINAPSSYDDVMSTAKKSIVRSGIVTDDLAILSKMDHSLNDRLPIKLNKDSSISQKSVDFVANMARFDELYQIISDNITKIGTEMRSGLANSIPFEKKDNSSPCDYCKNKAICRHKGGENCDE